MYIKKIIENEIKLELMVLSKYSVRGITMEQSMEEVVENTVENHMKDPVGNTIKNTIENTIENLVKTSEDALICKVRNGKYRFFIRRNGSKKQIYVPRSQFHELETMLRNRLSMDTCRAIKSNISKLQATLSALSEYDAETIELNMPLAYRRLKEVIDAEKETNAGEENPSDPQAEYFEDQMDQVFVISNHPVLEENFMGLTVIVPESNASVPQSENPKNREGLKFRTSFGLMVRSKNEMLIAEALYQAGIVFRYEQKLELVVSSGTEGHEMYNTEILYPDFTIYLPDGDIIYWEHLGMMDDDKYYTKNMHKLNKYFNSGIYPPKNLIITMDGEKMPFDNTAIWRYINGLLLSRY